MSRTDMTHLRPNGPRRCKDKKRQERYISAPACILGCVTYFLAFIPLSELHPFANHPFKVQDDEAMTELAASIIENGVINPGIARPREGGGYELCDGLSRAFSPKQKKPGK